MGYCLGEVSAIKNPREGTGKVPLLTKQQVNQLAEFNRQDRVKIEFESFKKQVSAGDENSANLIKSNANSVDRCSYKDHSQSQSINKFHESGSVESKLAAQVHKRQRGLIFFQTVIFQSRQ